MAPPHDLDVGDTPIAEKLICLQGVGNNQVGQVSPCFFSALFNHATVQSSVVVAHDSCSLTPFV